MNSILSIIVTILFIVIVAKLVLKKYNSVFIFMASGILVLLAFSLITGHSVLGQKSTGNLIVDVFAYTTEAFKSNASGVGMILMAVTGYAVYMSHIGASTKLAFLATKPLSKIKSPYVVLSFLYYRWHVFKTGYHKPRRFGNAAYANCFSNFNLVRY